MGSPENGNFPLLCVVKMLYLGGWVVQKSLKTPLRNIKMAPYHDIFLYRWAILEANAEILKIISSFFWKIYDTTIFFWDFLTFRRTHQLAKHKDSFSIGSKVMFHKKINQMYCK